MKLLSRRAACLVALACLSACKAVPPNYFAPQAASGRALPSAQRDAARFQTDGAYELSAGAAAVVVEIDAGADGRATGLFLQVHVPAGSTAGFSSDDFALTTQGASARLRLPFSLTGQPLDPGATVAPPPGTHVRSWKANLALPRSDATVYDVQLPPLVVDGVTYPLPVVRFTAARGWAWSPTA